MYKISKRKYSQIDGSGQKKCLHLYRRSIDHEGCASQQ